MINGIQHLQDHNMVLKNITLELIFLSRNMDIKPLLFHIFERSPSNHSSIEDVDQFFKIIILYSIDDRILIKLVSQFIFNTSYLPKPQNYLPMLPGDIPALWKIYQKKCSVIQLNDKKVTQSYSFKKNRDRRSVFSPNGKLQIFLQSINGKHFILEVEPTDRIEDVKTKIQ
jgi:hypothetical protein